MSVTKNINHALDYGSIIKYVKIKFGNIFDFNYFIENFKNKNVGQIEETLKFILNPLEKLWESVASEKGEVPKIKEKEREEIDNAKNKSRRGRR